MIVSSKYPLSHQEFNEIYSKVPRLTVEVLFYDEEKGVFLTERAIAPFKGVWHLPGGTVFLGESLVSAVKRVAKKEVNVDVSKCHLVGFIEYPSLHEKGQGYPVGMVFKVDEYSGIPVAAEDEASDGKWFSSVPEKIHGDQDTYLLSHGYLSGRSVIKTTA